MQEEKENDESEMQVICEILKLSGGSKCEDVSSFGEKPLKKFVEIDDSVEIIEINDFLGNDSFTEVVFSSTSQLKEISGFQQCRSLD
jgi:hypothetical protein